MELRNVWLMLRKRLWLVLLIVLIATATTGYYTQTTYQPIYPASAKLIVNKTIQSGDVEQMDINAIYVNMHLINTYREIIKSTSIMNKVLEKYPDLGYTAGQLIYLVNVSAIEGTQVMLVSAADTNYERAARIVNAVADVFIQEIPSIMKIDNVTLLNEASLTEQPAPINHPLPRNLIFSFVISLLFSLGLVFFLEYLDDTVKSEEDVRQVFEAPVLASVAKVGRKDLATGRQGKKRAQMGEAPYVTINQ